VTRLYVGEECCLLAGGVSVEARAHVLDLHLERRRVRPAPGALEGHMLQEVRRTVGAGKLVPAAGVDPDADGGHLGVGRVGLRDDAEARGERGNARHREAEEGGVVSGAALRPGVAEEAVGGGDGDGTGVEEAVEIREEPAPRADCGGRDHAGFDGGVATPPGRGTRRGVWVFLSRLFLAAAGFTDSAYLKLFKNLTFLYYGNSSTGPDSKVEQGWCRTTR
jgi:hypothetical protein